MKHQQRGHIEAEYGDLKPEATMWIGVAICAVGFAVVVISLGWLAAIGIAVAMWGYRLQMDGSDKLDRARTAGVASPETSAWWTLVMGATAAIEDAANCLRDPDAKKQADGAAKHYRAAAQKLMASHGVPESGNQTFSRSDADTAASDYAVVNLAKLRSMPVTTAEEGRRAGTAHGSLEVLRRMGFIEHPADADATAKAFQIADEAMFELLHSECYVHIGLLVFPPAAACGHDAARRAFDWLQPRGYVDLATGKHGQFIRILKEPGQ